MQVKALAPQVMHASKIVFENPDSEAAREHYQLLKEDYQRQVEKLTKLVDSGVDPVLFIAASGTFTHTHVQAHMHMLAHAHTHTHTHRGAVKGRPEQSQGADACSVTTSASLCPHCQRCSHCQQSGGHHQE